MFFFVETREAATEKARPRVRMTLCESLIQARECAADITGETVLHEVEASRADLAACKLVAQHTAHERDIRFFRYARRREYRAGRL